MVQKSDGPITIENFKEKILEGYRLKLIKFHKLKDDVTLDQALAALADREEKRRSPRSPSSPSSPKSPGGGSKRRSNSRRRIKSRKTKKTRTTRRLLMKHRR